MSDEENIRQQIIEDLQKVDEKVEESVNYEEYLKHGSFSLYEVRSKHFDTWRKAKQAAGIQTGDNMIYEYRDVTREEMLEDLRRIEDKGGRNWKDKVHNYSKYTYRHYMYEFDKLSRAVKEAGCELYRDPEKTLNHTRQELIENLQELEEPGKFVSVKEVSINYNYYFETAEQARRKADLDIVTEKDLYEFLSETVKSKLSNGFYKHKYIDQLSKQHHNLSISAGGIGHITDFVKYFNENNEESIRLSSQGGNNQGFYYNDGSYDSEDKYEKMMRRKYSKFVGKTREVGNPEVFEEFKELVGMGVSPRGAYSTLLYVSYKDVFTQDDVADDIGSTPLTIRNNQDRAEKVLQR